MLGKSGRLDDGRFLMSDGALMSDGVGNAQEVISFAGFA